MHACNTCQLTQHSIYARTRACTIIKSYVRTFTYIIVLICCLIITGSNIWFSINHFITHVSYIKSTLIVSNMFYKYACNRHDTARYQWLVYVHVYTITVYWWYSSIMPNHTYIKLYVTRLRIQIILMPILHVIMMHHWTNCKN